jgi:hypothetical protein
VNDVFVSGLKFIGGRHHLHLESPNFDHATVRIEKCEFQNASEYSIYTLGTTSAEDTHLSTQLTIERSKFFMNRQVLLNNCDFATVRDTWVTVGDAGAGVAAFVNKSPLSYSSLRLVDFIGIPSSNTSGARWVDNYGSFTAQRSRFSSEGRTHGMSIVFNYSPPTASDPWMGGSIIIENSQISVGNGGAVISLMTEVPTQVRLVGNSYLIQGPYVRNAGNLDLRPCGTYFRKYGTLYYFQGEPCVVAGASKELHDRFKFVIEPNMAWPLNPVVPDELIGFVQPKPAFFPTGTRSAAVRKGGATIGYFLPTHVATFTALVTISTNPNPAGNPGLRTTNTYLLSYITGYAGAHIADFLRWKPLFAVDSTTSVGVPNITSVGFGSVGTPCPNTESCAQRPHTAGGRMLINFGPATTNYPAEASIELLHVGYSN